VIQEKECLCLRGRSDAKGADRVQSAQAVSLRAPRAGNYLNLVSGQILPFTMTTTEDPPQSKEEAFSRYAELFRSPDPNSKLLALGEFVFRVAKRSGKDDLLRCALATDFVFLDRMLRNGIHLSREVDKDIKLHKDLNGSELKDLQAVAVSVLRVFAKLEEMIRRPEMYERIPALVLLLKKEYFDRTEGTDFRDGKSVEEVLDTLLVLSTIPQAADLLLKPEVVSTLLEILPSASTSAQDCILKIFSSALQNASARIDSQSILKPIADLFATSKDLCLVSEIVPFLTQQFELVPPSPSLKAPLYQGLKCLALHKIEDETRVNVLILQGFLIIHLGFEFLFRHTKDREAKIFALLSIRLASAGCQANLPLLTPTTSRTDFRRLLAEMAIIQATTTWLLSQDDDTIEIGGTKLKPDEILQIQDWMVSAVRAISLFLRQRYDAVRMAGRPVTFEEQVDPIVRSAVKVVCGWYAEDAGDEALGLFDVLLAVCITRDAELVAWAMSGIRGIIVHTDKGADELWTSKDVLLKLLDVLFGGCASPASEGTMIMIREVALLFDTMVAIQPLCITEPAIRAFPGRVLEQCGVDVLDKNDWYAKSYVSLFAVTIVLKMEETEPLLKRARNELARKGLARMLDLAKSRAWPEEKDHFIPISHAIGKLELALAEE
jgi:Neurochondrin